MLENWTVSEKCRFSHLSLIAHSRMDAPILFQKPHHHAALCSVLTYHACCSFHCCPFLFFCLLPIWLLQTQLILSKVCALLVVSSSFILILGGPWMHFLRVSIILKSSAWISQGKTRSHFLLVSVSTSFPSCAQNNFAVFSNCFVQRCSTCFAHDKDFVLFCPNFLVLMISGVIFLQQPSFGGACPDTVFSVVETCCRCQMQGS